MRIPFDTIAGAVRAGVGVKRETDVPVRVAVYVDPGAPQALIACIREAFRPQTTSGLVRVSVLVADPAAPKPDTDVVLVLTSGSDHLRDAVQQLVISGAPVVVLAESSVEAPFIQEDTRMLGLIAATDAGHLLDRLASWILARTDKGCAFAANFPFIREIASREVVEQAVFANAVTGALVFMPGADFPVMTLTQLGMMFKLASIYGKPVHPERAYEAAGIFAAGLLMRAGTRAAASRAGRAAFAVKALSGGVGTLAVGAALCALYERGIDYAPVNEAVGRAVSRVTALVAPRAETSGAPAADTL